LLHQIFSQLHSKKGVFQRYFELKNHPLYTLALLFLLPQLFAFVPSQYLSAFQIQTQCREQANKVESRLKELSDKGIVYVDAYVPVPSNPPKNLSMQWEMHPEMLLNDQVIAVVLNKAYNRIYLPAEEGGKEVPHIGHIKNLQKTREFYMIFNQKEEALLSEGKLWKKTYQDACFFEIWERKF
jgi:hypothetical protein